MLQFSSWHPILCSCAPALRRGRAATLFSVALAFFCDCLCSPLPFERPRKCALGRGRARRPILCSRAPALARGAPPFSGRLHVCHCLRPPTAHRAPSRRSIAEGCWGSPVLSAWPSSWLHFSNKCVLWRPNGVWALAVGSGGVARAPQCCRIGEIINSSKLYVLGARRSWTSAVGGGWGWGGVGRH